MLETILPAYVASEERFGESLTEGLFPEEQPVWLTEKDENPNGAAFLFLTDGADSGRIAAYERCFDLFDGNDPAALDAARARWQARKAEGHAVTYWQQTERGGWEKKA